MENRIQINGVWYVREDISKEEQEDIEVTYSMSCHYETKDYFWEATRLLKEDGISYYPDIDIKFTDKRNKPWKEDHWDGNAWMVAVMNNDPDAMKEARESMCEQGIKEFKLFLNKLEENFWLSKK
jgi:hypothetical protein